MDPFKVVDTLEITLTEAARKAEETVIENLPQPRLSPVCWELNRKARTWHEIQVEEDDGTIHTGVFRGTVPVDSAEEVVAGDTKLQARAGDLIRISYHDALNISAGPQDLSTAAKCVEGNLGGVRVTRTEIGDAELALKTQLKTASALTQIGTQYRDFGFGRQGATQIRGSSGRVRGNRCGSS